MWWGIADRIFLLSVLPWERMGKGGPRWATMYIYYWHTNIKERVTEHIGENCGTKLKLANMSSIGNKNWQTWVTLATLGNALTRVDKGWQGLTRVVNYWSSFRTTGRTGEHWHWIGATLGRSYKHCRAAGKLRGNFGETLGATGYWVLGTGYWQTLAGNEQTLAGNG